LFYTKYTTEYAIIRLGFNLNKVRFVKDLLLFVVGLVVGAIFIKYNATSVIFQTANILNRLGADNSGILALVVAAVSSVALIFEILRNLRQ